MRSLYWRITPLLFCLSLCCQIYKSVFKGSGLCNNNSCLSPDFTLVLFLAVKSMKCCVCIVSLTFMTWNSKSHIDLTFFSFGISFNLFHKNFFSGCCWFRWHPLTIFGFKWNHGGLLGGDRREFSGNSMQMTFQSSNQRQGHPDFTSLKLSIKVKEKLGTRSCMTPLFLLGPKQKNKKEALAKVSQEVGLSTLLTLMQMKRQSENDQADAIREEAFFLEIPNYTNKSSFFPLYFLPLLSLYCQIPTWLSKPYFNWSYLDFLRRLRIIQAWMNQVPGLVNFSFLVIHYTKRGQILLLRVWT